MKIALKIGPTQIGGKLIDNNLAQIVPQTSTKLAK